MTKSWMGVLGGAILGGAVGGAVAYLVASRGLHPRADLSESRTLAVGHAAASRSLPNQEERLRAEIARVGNVQNRDEASAERLRKLEEDMRKLIAQRDARETPPEMPTEEQARAEFSKLVEAHERDAKDPDWSPTSTARLEASLRAESQRGMFSTVSVDCRTTTCVATLEWASPEAAEQHARWVVAAPLATNCSRQLRLSDATGGDGARRAVLLLDCADWRAEGSQPLRIGTAADAEPRSGEPSTL